jgi:hypothetical protein
MHERLETYNLQVTLCAKAADRMACFDLIPWCRASWKVFGNVHEVFVKYLESFEAAFLRHVKFVSEAVAGEAATKRHCAYCGSARHFGGLYVAGICGYQMVMM